jgi:hypothetical protein
MQSPRQLITILASVGMAATPSCSMAQQIHKCVKDGKISFQERPCDGSSTAVAKSVAVTTQLPWENIRLGMTIDEVRRVALIPEKLEIGTNTLLRKSGGTISGISLSATYFFDSAGRLVSVIAQPAKGEPGSLHMDDNDRNLADYERLVLFLRGKYGAEKGRRLKNKDTGFSGLSANTEWMVEGGTVFAALIPVTATTSTLHLGFK